VEPIKEAVPVTVYAHIDAKVAAALLELNRPHAGTEAGTNRPLRKKVIEKYAQDMLAGKWEVTNQGIGLIGEAPNEILIDGQHRLYAVLLAAQTNPDIKVIMAVTKGLRRSAVSAIDTALRRSGGDVLVMERGIKNPNVIAAAMKLVHLYDEVPWSLNAWSSFFPTHAQLLDMADKYPDIIEANVAISSTGRIIPASPLTAATFLAMRERPDINIALFLHGLRTGADLGERSPILALRNYGLNAIKNGVRREPPAMLALTIRALNAWVIDDRRTNMRFEAAQPFPRITDRKWVAR
jgi:hypothetical protein